MLNPNPDSGIDSLFNIHTEVTSLVDVPVTTIVEPSFLATTILPPPPNPLITQVQQTPALTPTNVLSSSLQDFPNFGSLFGFDHRPKALEDNFLKFTQMNPFAIIVSSIPSIVDQYLDNRMNDVVKTAVQLQSERLREEGQAENQEFLNLIDADTVTFKRRRDDADDDEEPPAGLDRGSKRRRFGKEPESTSAPKEKTYKSTGSSKEGTKSNTMSTDKSAHVEEPVHTVDDLEQPAHQEFNTGFTEDQPAEETTQFPDWF
ncbi:hypothetical protein Tco_0282461 [Tanacetum coccineum]